MVTEYQLPSNMTDCFQILVRRQQVTVTFQMKPVHTQIHYRHAGTLMKLLRNTYIFLKTANL